MMKLTIIAGLVFAYSSGISFAETYCRAGVPLTTLWDGAVGEVDWTVTASGMRKVQNALQTKPAPGCAWSGSFLGGMNKPMQIIQGPSRGKITFFRTYQLVYTSNSPGSDKFAVRVFWLDRNSGKPNQATVNFNVTVVATPI